MAHLALSRPRHHHRRRAPHLESLKAQFTAYPFEERASFQLRRPRSRQDLGDQLAHRPPRRPRNLHGHALLRAAPVRRRHPHPGPHLLRRRRRRPPRAARPSKPSTTRAFPTASRAAAIPVPCRRPFPPSRCSGSACSTTTGCTAPTPQPVRALAPGHALRARLVRRATSSPTACSTSFPGGASLTGSPPAKFPPTMRQRRILHHHARISRRARRCRRSRAQASAIRFSPPAISARRARARRPLRQVLERRPRTPRRQPRQEDLQPAGQHPRRPLRRHSQSESAGTSCNRILAIEPGTTPDGVLSASYYFRFYLARALDHAGMADEYLQLSRSVAQAAAACTSAPGLRFPATPAPTRMPGPRTRSTTC